jgi:hypothetical protein
VSEAGEGEAEQQNGNCIDSCRDRLGNVIQRRPARGLGFEIFDGLVHTVRTICRVKAGRLAAAHADVLESHGAKAHRVQQIFGIDDDRLLEQVLDAVEVEGAELGPAGADD